MTRHDVVLRSGASSVIIDLDAGGRIAQIHAGGDSQDESVELLVDPGDRPAWSSGWGSFPMAPWAGRIREGHFQFLDDDVQLDLNHRDAAGDTGGGPIEPARAAGPDRSPHEHAIHGTTFTRQWLLDDVTDSSCSLHCPIAGRLGWPYAGVARQTIELDDRSVRMVLAVESTSDPFPATLGWHPWFAKPAGLQFTPLAMYEQDEYGLPTGRLVPPSDGPWDDCFVHRGEVVLRYARDLAALVTISSDCDHWVVFDAPAHATCVEPQSGPPDGPNLRPEIVAAGHPLQRTMTIAW